MGILLFIAAGTFAWPGAWTYLVLMVTLSFTLGIDLARKDPGLLQERMGSPVQRGQPAADKMLLIALLLLMLAWLVLMGLDAKRFAWSSVSALMRVLGALIILWSIWFCYRTMRENSFAAPVIKLQQERGQRVIQSDLTPSSATQCTSAPLSTSLSPHCCSAHGGASSSLSPDRPPLNPHPHRGKVLRAGLVGYDEYAAHVRYRLIPHVW
jgi:protein-S-isoprenylcysteine O-methyltransferase Ste14